MARPPLPHGDLSAHEGDGEDSSKLYRALVAFGAAHSSAAISSPSKIEMKSLLSVLHTAIAFLCQFYPWLRRRALHQKPNQANLPGQMRSVWGVGRYREIENIIEIVTRDIKLCPSKISRALMTCQAIRPTIPFLRRRKCAMAADIDRGRGKW